MENKNILVTGISGYIGGQTALMLKDQGYNVLGIDVVPLPEHLNNVCDHFSQIDFVDIPKVELLKHYQITAIVHCAGTSLVGPSMAHPSEYYDNNVVKTKYLLDYLVSNNFQGRFIFSSSAAIYGEPILSECHEEDPPLPISPYGESKLMVEMMMNSYRQAYNLSTVAFRYFNACGADSQGRHGQAPNATHIIARVLESIRDDRQFTLYGDNYPTNDGTCVRDYVHVEDIARAHVLAIDPKISDGIYNLGFNTGISNREIIQLAEQVTGKSLNVVVGEPRPGDPAVLTASSEKFDSVADNWRRYSLTDMISHAWKWYTR